MAQRQYSSSRAATMAATAGSHGGTQTENTHMLQRAGDPRSENGWQCAVSVRQQQGGNNGRYGWETLGQAAICCLCSYILTCCSRGRRPTHRAAKCKWDSVSAAAVERQQGQKLAGSHWGTQTENTHRSLQQGKATHAQGGRVQWHTGAGKKNRVFQWDSVRTAAASPRAR
jgi:hypothetical protein